MQDQMLLTALQSKFNAPVSGNFRLLLHKSLQTVFTTLQFTLSVSGSWYVAFALAAAGITGTAHVAQATDFCHNRTRGTFFVYSGAGAGKILHFFRSGRRQQ